MNADDARQRHLEAFVRVFEVKHPKTFGGGLGLHDSNEGVQWNAGTDGSGNGPSSGWVGVNLEGMTYDNWPIDRLIERELGRFSLFKSREKIERPDEITVRWTKDVWANRRLRVDLQEILGVRLSDLSEDNWPKALIEAQRCLNRKDVRRRRAWQLTTVKGVTKEREVSPHLQLSCILWRDEPPSKVDLEERMRGACNQFEPLYREIGDLSKK